MRTVAIIQARMGSTRLPGKALMEIEGKTMLERVVERSRGIPGVDDVVVAIPISSTDDVLSEICHRLDIVCHRGSELDVLDRYVVAAHAAHADVIMRVTSDCPLLDPEVSGKVVREFTSERPDYASNTLVRTYPRGLDTEILPVGILELAGRESEERPDREHVTRFVWRQPSRFRLLSVKNSRDESHRRWTVDTADDLEFIRCIYNEFGDALFSYEEALAVVQDHPEWVRINAHIEQKPL